jgi:hypothetical protein
MRATFFTSLIVISCALTVGCDSRGGRGRITIDGDVELDSAMVDRDMGTSEEDASEEMDEGVPDIDMGVTGIDMGFDMSMSVDMGAGTDMGAGFDGGPATGFVGAPCETDADCGSSAACIGARDAEGASTGFVDGYCISLPPSCDDGACPSGTACFNLNLGETVPACIDACTTSSECRLGYVCDADDTCWPGCDETRPCPSGLTCGASGVCVDPMTLPMCSPSNPTGTCEGVQVCVSGVCMTPPPCDEDTHEPNETRTAATTVTVGTPIVAGRCASDTDWYRIDVPAGQIVQVHAAFPAPTTANLDLYAYRSDGTPLGARVADIDSTPSWARAYETSEEGFGFYTGATTGGTYYVKVTGATAGAAGSYVLTTTSTPWTDGLSCTGAGYTMSQCTGGSAGSQTLIANPFPDPADTYAGSEFVHDTVSNYRYLRRETLMLIRYAAHEVEARFPGTNPIGFIDQCQRDAITPGYDVDDPRHPESTHDQGGNIDIAYYQTGSDNHARIICDNAEGSEDGSYCLASAGTTHIVDLQRQVYFMAMLTRSPRVRVIGVDRVIAPLLEAQARTMQSSGVITMTEMNAVIDSMAYGDGWPFHHHHIHLSLDWL